MHLWHFDSLDYWMFLFGKIGRALFLSQNNLEWSLFIVVVFILAIIGFLVGFYYRLIKFADYSQIQLLVDFFAYFFFCLHLPADHCRWPTNLRSSDVSQSLDVFSFGLTDSTFFG
jgi:hypothetical protein